jgi:carbamoyl-phosphate synthase small subunit
MQRRDKAKLLFEDGQSFEGGAFGARGEAYGEVVFNTAMSGYQEILTDPSYHGQLVLMTYPLIGNYGTNPEDLESARIYTPGFIVREISTVTSNFRSDASLDDYLRRAGVVGITDIDTREIVLQLRSKGAMRAVISSGDLDDASLHAKVLASPKTDGRDLVREVTRSAASTWSEPWSGEFMPVPMAAGTPRYKVVAYDFGIKHNILRSLTSSGFDVTVVPATTSAKEVMAMDPDGVFLSNGPGDPEPVGYAVEAIRHFLGEQIPLFGICLGHQLTALALGARTYKMKFGHHGANQPVMDFATGRIEITSQNHSFAVDADSLDEKKVRISHKNLNDDTVEGLELLESPCFTVQYHPEAAPGPRESRYLFGRFRELIEKHRAPALR